MRAFLALLIILGSTGLTQSERPAKSADPGTAPTAVPGKAAPGLPAPKVRDKAAIYQEAFEKMPELSKTGQAQMAQWDSIPFDLAVEELLAAYEPALQLMHEAVTFPGECDWKIDLEKEGLATRYPQVGPAHLLTRAALLRARRSMTYRRQEWAMSDVQAVRRMARDMGTTQVMVTLISAYGVENMAIEFLKDNISLLSPEMRPKLLQASRSLSLMPAISSAVHQERAYYRWLVRHLHKAEQDERFPVTAKALFERLGVPQTFQDLQRFEASWRTDLKQAYDLQGSLSKLAAAPIRTRVSSILAFEAQRESWSLVAQLMVPNIAQSCEQELALKDKRRKLDMALQR